MTKRKAFSIAEAMMALLITSVAIGAAAPMITKQIRHNNLSSVQTNILGREISQAETSINMNTNQINDIKVNVGTVSGRVDVLYNNKFIRDFLERDPSLPTYNEAIEEMEEEMSQQIAQQLSNKVDASRLSSMESSLINKISSEIEKLKEEFKSKFVPSGAVMYFDLTACPSGWTLLTNKYPNAANAFIRNQSGSGRTIGNYQTAAVPNIKGWFHAIDLAVQYSGPFYDTGNGKTVYGYGRQGEYYYRQQGMDLSRVSSVYQNGVNEVRPNNITLLACRKN